MSFLPLKREILASTFCPAPLDHNLSLPELYEYHALHSQSHPVFAYSDIVTGTPTSISYSEAWTNIQRVAVVVSAQLSESPGADPHKRPPVIAVLAQSG
jgi:acyl-CoA synthetase (AMP-forming)/AMP-acid ligase II